MPTPPDQTHRPDDLAPRSKVARRHFNFVACDEDGQHYLWECKHCQDEVRTTKHVSLLATHINGNAKAKVQPCSRGPKGVKKETEDGNISSSSSVKTKDTTESAMMSWAASGQRLANAEKWKTRRGEQRSGAGARAGGAHGARQDEASTIEDALEVVMELKKTIASLEAKLKAYRRAHPHGYHGDLRATSPSLSRSLKRRHHSISSSSSSLSSLSDGEKFVARLGPTMSVPYTLPVITRERMVGDGHCGFRAGAHAVWGDATRWKDLREALAQQLELGSAAYQEARLWTSAQETKLHDRLKSDATGIMADTAQWFGSIDCCVLLADLCHCPVVVLNEEHAGLSSVTPPSLSGKNQPPISALSEDQIGHLQDQAIVLIFNEAHWDFINTAKGDLPPLQQQWLALKDKLAGARLTWDPSISSLKESFTQGFIFRLPDSAPSSSQFGVRRSMRSKGKAKAP